MKIFKYINEVRKRGRGVLIIFFMLAVIIGCRNDYQLSPLFSIKSTSTPSIQVIPSTASSGQVTVSITPTLLSIRETETPFNSQTKEREVMKLFEDNGQCDFPCWWGYQPGQTKWANVQKTLESLASKMSIEETSDGKRLSAYYSFSVSRDLNGYPVSQKYTFINGILHLVEVEGVNIPRFRFQALLQNYGVPSEIWIRTWSNTTVDGTPFEVIVFNSNKGILAVFSERATIEEGYVKICFQDETLKSLVLWEPVSPDGTLEAFLRSESLSSIPNITDITSEENKYLPIEKAVGENLPSFYQKNIAAGRFCFQTPQYLWKEQFN